MLNIYEFISLQFTQSIKGIIMLDSQQIFVINSKSTQIQFQIVKLLNFKFDQMSNDDKRKVFQAYLQEQNKNREQLLEKKKVQQSSKNNPQEDMLFIQKTFREKQKCQIITKHRVVGVMHQVVFQQLNLSYQRLKQYYLEINYVLMTYDRQFYKEVLEKLYTAMIQMKNKSEPRKRFKFSRRAEDFGVKQDQIKTSKAQKKQKHSQSLAIPGLSNLKNQMLKIPHSNEPVGPYKIVECENSTVELEQRTEILFLKQLKNCTINCALSKSTVFVDNCTNCTFQLNCHQLRIHNTYDTTFKIFVTSKAIIEDCNRVVFTPYTYDYPNRLNDIKQFERENGPNYWREIQDFNWLKENQKSPHFSLQQTL